MESGSPNPWGRSTQGSVAPNRLWLVGCVLGLNLVFSCLGPCLSGKWPFFISLFIQGIFLDLFILFAHVSSFK
jgi:hypothetical protein